MSPIASMMASACSTQSKPRKKRHGADNLHGPLPRKNMLLENSAPVSVAGGVPRHYCVAASVRRRRSPHGGDSADGGANDPESLRNRLETAARGALLRART